MDAEYRLDWTTDAGALAAISPTRDELRAHAPALALGYNEPANAELMGHAEPMSAEDVAEHYEDMAAQGAHQFLLFVDGALVGDADLRGLREGSAEFAFMIAARGLQGKGLGTRFAAMIHVLAFTHLGLGRVYASIVPHNTASRRVFEKLGYTLDDSTAARAYADEPGDVVMSIDRAAFARTNAAALAQVTVSTRTAAR
jgi:RimJ/RimL family protein N-acetyltransferase